MKRIIKVGGSLLDDDGLPHALRDWLSAQSPGFNVLIAGGGLLADFIRAADGRFQLQEEVAHWLAIKAMSINAHLLRELLPGRPPVASTVQELQPGPDGLVVWDVEEFLRREEPQWKGVVLPRGWQVTSDSIAARLCEIIEADELVLLKSQCPAPPGTQDSAAGEGLVDCYFPTAAGQLAQVRCVNLRQPGFPETTLRRSEDA